MNAKQDPVTGSYTVPVPKDVMTGKFTDSNPEPTGFVPDPRAEEARKHALGVVTYTVDCKCGATFDSLISEQRAFAEFFAHMDTHGNEVIL